MGAFLDDKKKAGAPSPVNPYQATVPPRPTAQNAVQSAPLALPGALAGQGATEAMLGLFGKMFGAGPAKSGEELMSKAPVMAGRSQRLRCGTSKRHRYPQRLPYRARPI